MINRSLFIDLCQKNGLFMDEEKAEKLDGFAEYLITENEKYNLTAIKTPEGIMLRHFCANILQEFFKRKAAFRHIYQMRCSLTELMQHRARCRQPARVSAHDFNDRDRGDAVD